MLRSLLFIVILFLSSGAVGYGPNLVDAVIFKDKDHDHIYGKEDAPIRVLEYFSLTCPHCEYFFVSVFPQLKREYIDTGKVRWTKRSYVTDISSLKGTALLYCINKEDYTKYLTILLTKQASWAYQKDFISILRNIATLGGMNVKKFNDCMEDKKIEKEITRASEEAKKVLKISGTPSFYVNQEKVSVYSYQGFKDHLDELLAKK